MDRFRGKVGRPSPSPRTRRDLTLTGATTTIAAPAAPPAFLVAALTDVGRVRGNNEDHVLTERLVIPSGAWWLWVVADGVGGGPRGEIASELAVRTVRDAIAAGGTTEPGEALADAFRLANARVYAAAAREDPDGRRMATTLVAALVEESTGRAYVANVGDSRAYLLAPDGIRRISEDHSLVAMRVAAGMLSEAEAAVDASRNVLVRGIGSEDAVTVDLFGPRVLAPGERILLCSDGLHGLVDDQTIERIARATPTPSLPRALVDAANAAGGRDNISVVVGEALAPVPPADRSSARLTPRPMPRQGRKPPRLAIAAGITAVAMLVVVAVGALGAGLSGGGPPSSAVGLPSLRASPSVSPAASSTRGAASPSASEFTSAASAGASVVPTQIPATSRTR
jgi:protein phosphatase